ncbi:hypothetical protein EDB84DRAFT_1441829 [Lactarius hengduanensis]|nr:hypothetical protein EDB84DRAFT_1441829 [Lactarius hengduanensis]
MPPKTKHTPVIPKNARPKMASGSRKRQAHNNCESSSEDSEVTKRSQKRQRQKGKKRASVHVPVESVDEGSDKEPDEPEAVELDASDAGNAGVRPLHTFRAACTC